MTHSARVMMMRCTICPLWACLTGLAVVAAASAAASGLASSQAPLPVYSIFSVPQPLTNNSELGQQLLIARAVNVRGQFVGDHRICFLDQDFQCLETNILAATWDGLSVFDVSHAECANTIVADDTAVAINASGLAIGQCDVVGILFGSDGSLQQFPGLTLNGINASGQITGGSPDGGGGFRYSNGTITALGTLPGGTASYGFAINDDGVIVGSADNASGQGRAFITSGATLVDLGVLPGGTASDGLSINNAGEVVGDSDIPGGTHAFYYSSGTMLDLGTLGGANSVAYSINSSGDAVGESGTDPANSSQIHAFLYTGGQLVDLNSLIVASDAALVLTDAQSINDIGWIIANRGTVVAVPVTFAPRSLTFAPQTVGQRSATHLITITNSGHNNFPGDNVVVAGPYAVVNSCPALLTPGAACTIAVTYQPTAAGPQDGGIYINSLGIPATGSVMPTLALTASASSATTGQTVTLSWTSTGASTCVASGGAAGDGWPGNKSLNGTASLTTSHAGSVTYMISCADGGTPAVASVEVMYNDAPAGGGGQLDPGLLLGLLSLGLWRAARVLQRRGG